VREQSSFFGVPVEGRPSTGTGSGFVIDDKGHIVTNAHVVEGSEALKVSFDGERTFEAKIIGEDPSTDLAVIKVDPTDEGLKNALKPVQLGDSSALRVGDAVTAIGNPFSLDRTLTTGVVSALQRRIPSLSDQIQITGVIQTDAAINPGNSGGPLFNDRGEVIGVNSQIQSRGGDFAGVAFAIPSKLVMSIVEQLIEDGTASHAWLGVEGSSLDAEVSDLLKLPVDEGVLVARVSDGSPADKAGLKGGTREITVDGNAYVLGGDIITEFDGRKVTSMRQLVDLVAGTKPGDDVGLVYHRGDDRKEAKVEIGDRPSSLGNEPNNRSDK